MNGEATRFVVAKVNRRLWIRDALEDRLLYTPPDFIRLHDRRLLMDMAAAANARGELHIRDIAAFESAAPRAPGCERGGEERAPARW